jgi:glycosyltransferase involved in cell wall biosynthesis
MRSPSLNLQVLSQAGRFVGFSIAIEPPSQIHQHHLEKHVFLTGFRPDALSLHHAFDLFVMSSVTDVPFPTVVRGTLPFLVPMLIALVLVTFIPAISLVLPRMLGLA